MKFIKLTSRKNKTAIYINVDHIGDVFGVEATDESNSYIKDYIKEAYTSVGVTTNNNGGFQVIESVEQVMKLILE